MKTAHFQEITRGEHTIRVEVAITWSHDAGVYLEPNHPNNGYGAAWEIEEINAYDAYGATHELTQDEYDQAKQTAAKQLPF